MKLKPWELIRNHSLRMGEKDEELIPLWNDFKASDFYFTTSQGVSNTNIYIVPSEYFDANGMAFIDSIPITHLLPKYFEEIVECVYEAKNVLQKDVVCDLICRGFIINTNFREFIHSRISRYLP